MANMTHEKITPLDNVVIVTRKQLLAAEGLLGTLILSNKELTDDNLSDMITYFNQWLYHPETIPAFALESVEEAKEEMEED